jgi:orotate phosphoribosyltransferase
MQVYQAQFIEFMVQSGVLAFGHFVTKSGRPTPYFINTGRYDTGGKLARLGGFYAEALLAHPEIEYDCLFGPAYKGIPLVTATAIALAGRGREAPFAFNRKEAKDHGEGGALVGHKIAPGERVVIIEDVTTAGTSVRETRELLSGIGKVELTGLIVSVDRQERGRGERSALVELSEEFGIRTFPIVTLDDILAYLHGRSIDGRIVLDEAMLERVQSYRAQYGA